MDWSSRGPRLTTAFSSDCFFCNSSRISSPSPSLFFCCDRRRGMDLPNVYVHTTLYTHTHLLRFKQPQCYQLLSDPTLQRVHMGHREIHLTRRGSCPLTSQWVLQKCLQKMTEKLRYCHTSWRDTAYRNELLGEGSILSFLLVLGFSLLQKSICREGEEEFG